MTECYVDIHFAHYMPHVTRDITTKAPVTPNGVATAFVQRSKTMSARCGIAAEYT